MRAPGRQPSVYATNTRNSSAACSNIIPYLVLLRKGFTMRPSFQISPVGSCPTFSPLPWIFANPWRFVFCGTFLTAESGPQHPEELSRPGTSRTVESGLSSPENALRSVPERLPATVAPVSYPLYCNIKVIFILDSEKNGYVAGQSGAWNLLKTFNFP